MRVVTLAPRQDREPTLDSLLPGECADLRDALLRYDDVRDRDLRGRDHRFLVESERCVRRFLRSSAFECESLLLSPHSFSTLQAEIRRHREIEAVFLADEATMTTIAGYRLHGGSLAIGRRPWNPPPATGLVDKAIQHQVDRLVVTEGVDHVDNLGSIIRSAACLGWKGLIVDERSSDPLLRKAIRFSMGRIFELEWGVSRDLPGDLERLRAGGVTVVGLELVEGSRQLAEIRSLSSMALVVGSEAHGLSRATMDCCDIIASIPVAESQSADRNDDSDARSLNVGVAAGIALYHFNGQRPADPPVNAVIARTPFRQQ